MATTRPRWPTEARTLFFDDVASRTTLSKAVADERIRRLAPRIYSADLTSAPSEIIGANWSLLCGRLLPGAVVVDRSAANPARVVSDGILTSRRRHRPQRHQDAGLEIPDPLGTPHESIAKTHGLLMSAPHALSLTTWNSVGVAAGRPSRTLTMTRTRDWVARKHIAWAPNPRIAYASRHATWRPQQDRSPSRHHQRPIRPTPASNRSAGPANCSGQSTTGQAWDERRILLFAQAADALSQLSPPAVPDSLPECDPPGDLPFYESYFSNYIEGTTFTVDQARHIVETDTPPAERPADGHDILGTYRCVVDPVGRAATSTDPDELIGHLTTRHQEIMRGRPDKNPGQWKTENNRVGAYDFVDKDLVEGTLHKGLEQIGALPEGFPRALYVMIVITEIHPFEDGNGRVARVMMNAELSATAAARIVIPSVYRDEYVAGLRRASTTDGDLTAFVRVMTFAWRWSAAMPWDDPTATSGQLIATNALLDPTDAAIQGVQLRLP